MKHTRKIGTGERTISSVLFDIADVVVCSVVFVSLVFTFLFRVVTVEGPSMSPNYINGEKLLISNSLDNPKMGDVVIVADVLEEGPIIKRVIATAGQIVDFDEETKSVLVDGKVINDSQFGVKQGITEVTWKNYEMLQFPQTVPEGCVFVLGDNRVFSKDSRFAQIGMIDKRKILGKALVNIYPFNRIGLAK